MRTTGTITGRILTMKTKSIPSPCVKDCANRKCHCQLECGKYKIFQKIKNYQENKNNTLWLYKIKNELSWEQILKQYYMEKHDYKKAKQYI